MPDLQLVAYIVLVLGIANLARVAAFLIGSELYDIRQARKQKSLSGNALASVRKVIVAHNPKRNFPIFRPGFLNARGRLRPNVDTYKPLVTIIVPAHNEEKTLERNLRSILDSSYKHVELIIVNDSSDDRTPRIARNYQKKYRGQFERILVLDVNVRGKARALNAGLKHARGELFMCLDADSALTKRAVEYGVDRFRDRKIVTLSSNVKIFTGKGLLNLFQRIEYLVCYQMKKTETLANTQYIVGGIGSMFRTKLVKELGGYDTDTITEDIDLSMKIIGTFGNGVRIGYDPRMVVFTEAVIDIRGLLQQRFRWKYGRYQVFLKQKHLFWSRSKHQNRLLTLLYLPYALFGELAYVLEPLTFGLLLFLLVSFGDATMLIGSFTVFLFYTTIQITGATTGYTTKERVKFVMVSPLAYFGMCVLSFVEYVATVRGLLNSKRLITDYRHGAGDCNWQHVERAGVASPTS